MRNIIKKGLLILTAAAVLPAALLWAQTGGNGQQIFLQHKCNLCHTIKALGIQSAYKGPEDKRPPDLSDVGTKHNADWIAGFVTKKEELDGKKHKKRFEGSDDDLKALAGWLASQKHK